MDIQNTPSQAWLDQPASYQIIVKGRLDASWTEWFDGLTIVPSKDDDGMVVTTLAGPVLDQVALHGLLARIRDLGVTLLQVQRLERPVRTNPLEHENE